MEMLEGDRDDGGIVRASRSNVACNRLSPSDQIGSCRPDHTAIGQGILKGIHQSDTLPDRRHLFKELICSWRFPWPFLEAGRSAGSESAFGSFHRFNSRYSLARRISGAENGDES
jgi:hypothetical protein